MTPTQILGVYQDHMIWANVIWLQLVSTENFHNFWFLMFPGLSYCATLPNAHVYHQKPLFVPSRRKHVIRLQLIPRVSDACFAATMDWSISHSWQVWWFCPKIFLARCFCAQFELSIINYVCMVVLLYPDISNFKILKCKIFLINFLDELGNFKQKNFYTSKCKIFLHFKATDPVFHFKLGNTY